MKFFASSLVAAAIAVTTVHVELGFFFFKQSLIAYILSRTWRWTAATGFPVGLSPLPGQSLPPPYLLIYIINPATASHHSASSHNISNCLPLPSPTHGQLIKCAAFCAVHPSHTHQRSSLFPISHNHWRCGPLSVTIYTNPLNACLDHFKCCGDVELGVPTPTPPGIPSTSAAQSQLAALSVRTTDATGYSRSKFPHWDYHSWCLQHPRGSLEERLRCVSDPQKA